MGVKEMISKILNPSDDGREWKDFSITKDEKIINTINIVDLKGKKFRFPGSYQMIIDGNEVTFKAIKK